MRPVRKADNLPPSCAVVTKSGSLNFLEPSGPVQACNGNALPFTLITLSADIGGHAVESIILQPLDRFDRGLEFRAIRPQFHFWALQRQGAILWTLAHVVHCRIQHRSRLSLIDSTDYTRRARWKAYRTPHRQEKLGN